MHRHLSSRAAMPAVVASAILLLAGCGEMDLTNNASPTEPSFAKAAPTIPLRITVEDQDPTGAPYRVRSDGGGPYVHGLQTVRAEIDGFGNLQFRVEKTTAPARTLTVDFSEQIDGVTYQPPAAGQQGLNVLTSKVNNGNPSLADLGINASGCYATTIAYPDATTSYQSFFNSDANQGSTFAYITRTSATTWRMVTNDLCGSTPHAAALHTQLQSSKRPEPRVFRGNYNLRFSMILEAL